MQRNGSGLGTDAPRGVQTAFLRSGNSTTSRFSKPILLDAGTYRIRFKAAQSVGSSGVPIQVKLDATALGAPIAPTSTAFDIDYSAPFQVNADGSTYRLEFGTDSLGGYAMSLIDAVSIEPVAPVSSGGFETPVYGSAPFYGARPAGSDWSWSGAAGISHNGGLGADAPEGVQTAFLQGGATASFFSQNIAPGAGTYQVKFKAAQRASGGGVPIQVPVDGTAIGAPVSPTSASAFAVYTTPTFTIGAGNHELRFATNGTNSASMSLVDDVKVKDSSLVVLPVPLTPFAPKALTVTTITGRASLSWRPVDGVTGYRIKRGTVAGGPYVTLPTTITGTSFNDSPLSNGVTYYYRVTAFNDTSVSNDSNEVSATPMAAPVVTVTGGTNQIFLSWNPVVGATRYSVTDTVNQSLQIFGRTMTDTHLAPSSTFSYRVTAFNATGSSTILVRGTTLPGKPRYFTAVADQNNGSINLEWDSDRSDVPLFYKVKRATVAGGPYATLAPDITDFQYSDADLGGATYYYRIYAFNSSGTGPDSDEVSVTIITNPPAAAPTLSGTVTYQAQGGATANLSWTAVAGATKYRLSRSAGSSSNAQIFEIPSGLTYADTQISSGVTYRYSVRAANNGGDGPSSNEVVLTRLALPAVPARLVAISGNSQIALNWDAVSGATGYKIKRSTTDGGPYTTLAPSVTSNSYLDTGLTNGTPYYYRVYAVNTVGNSADSNQAQATPVALPAIPTNLIANAGDTQIVLNWDAVGNATSYKIRRSTTDGGPYTTLSPSVTANAYTDTGLSNGTPYYYRVYAVNTAGNGADSNQAQATPMSPATLPAAPTGFTATAVGSKITLFWNAVNGATNYKLFRSTTSGTYNYATPLPTIAAPATSYDDNSAATGTTYFYVVRAVNAAGESINSNQQSARITAAPASQIEILYPQAGAIISSTQSVVLRLKSTTILAQDRWHLSVDGGYFSSGVVKPISTSSGVNISFALNTSMFSNGVHSLRVYDGANHFASVSVGFQNDVSNVMCSPVFDVTRSLPMVPGNAFVKGTVAAGYQWEVYITDLKDNLVRYYSGIGDGSATSMNVTWDGKDASQVIAPPGNYKIYVKSSPQSSNLQSGRREAQPVHKSSDSVQIVIAGDSSKVELMNEQGEVIRTFEKGNSKNFIWDGRDDYGDRVPNGDYIVVKYPDELPQVAAAGSASGGKIDPIQLALKLLMITNNVVNGDSLILICQDAMVAHDGAAQQFVDAAIYINIFMGHIRDGNTQKMDVDAAVPLLIADWMMDDPLAGPAIRALINYKFGRPLKFVHVTAHGRSYSVPNFRIGFNYRWFSGYPGNSIGGGVSFDPFKHFDVRQLIADGGIQYGESGEDLLQVDPPIVVWITVGLLVVQV